MGVNSSSRQDVSLLSDEDVNFDHFQILRNIGKGSFGKVMAPIRTHSSFGGKSKCGCSDHVFENSFRHSLGEFWESDQRPTKRITFSIHV
ncbi:serine/threonine-protein kinase 32B-like [Armigeres subalbatus]|uniref:serine/threonine-protein kinase 32B-like n=1 Tax=Armigeres subalbatus TaxID=124917 RepID=UPI002ED4E7DC